MVVTPRLCLIVVVLVHVDKVCTIVAVVLYFYDSVVAFVTINKLEVCRACVYSDITRVSRSTLCRYFNPPFESKRF